MTEPDLVSLVIPVCNEEESLPALVAEIDSATRAVGRRIEIVFVDDGSRDRSWSVIEGFANNDSRIRGIRFRRNFGKAAALAAGFAETRGSVVLTLDADLQDDPREIPRFLEAINGGLDVVSGWKKIRHDPWHKVFPSRVFNALVSRISGVPLHDHNCGFKAYRAQVLDEVRLYGERHRFVPVLADARGFLVGELVIQHRARQFGRSKYGVRRFVKGFFDLISVRFLTAFRGRPQHFLGSVGLVPLTAGLLILLVVFVDSLLAAIGLITPMSGFAIVLLSLFALAGILGGVLFIVAGLLAELIVERSHEQMHPYSIAATTRKTDP